MQVGSLPAYAVPASLSSQSSSLAAAGPFYRICEAINYTAGYAAT